MSSLRLRGGLTTTGACDGAAGRGPPAAPEEADRGAEDGCAASGRDGRAPGARRGPRRRGRAAPGRRGRDRRAAAARRPPSAAGAPAGGGAGALAARADGRRRGRARGGAVARVLRGRWRGTRRRGGARPRWGRGWWRRPRAPFGRRRLRVGDEGRLGEVVMLGGARCPSGGGLVGQLVGLRAERGRAEHAQHGLLRPLPRGLAARGFQDRVAFGQVLDGAHEDGGEGLEHPLAAHRHRGDAVHLARVHRAVHELDVHHLGQVALVVLEDQGHGRGVEAVGEQVLGHLPEALQVLFPAIDRGVGHEDQAVRVLQHQASGGGVHGLPGHGQDLQAQVEAAEPGAAQGEKVEEDGAVLRGVDGDHLPPPGRLRVLVQDLEVRSSYRPPEGRSRRS